MNSIENNDKIEEKDNNKNNKKNKENKEKFNLIRIINNKRKELEKERERKENIKTYSIILKYFRYIFFILSLFTVLYLINVYTKIGFFGYLYLIIECFYIIVNIKILLEKNKKVINDIPINIMQIGKYLYMFVIFIRTIMLDKLMIFENISFYTNNAVILGLLTIIIVFYILIFDNDFKF